MFILTLYAYLRGYIPMASKNTSNNMMAKIGVWAYIAGLIIAALVGLMAWISGNDELAAWAVIVLAILGIVVGLLNIGPTEVNTFLLGAVAFVIASSGMSLVLSTIEGDWARGLEVFMNAIVVFTAPGALVVAFKALYSVASDD
jgi:hypothetical protein